MNRDSLLKFMQKVGKTSEVALFWKAYRNLKRIKFAIISINTEVIRTQLDVLAEDIAMMNRLDIYPILILETLPDEPISLQKRRFTTLSQKVLLEIRRKKGRAKVTNPVFYWEDDKLKLDLKPIERILANNQTPIVFPLCIDQNSLIDSDMMEHHLVKTIKPKKYILLSESGGILDTTGHLLPFLNISQDEEWTQQVGKTCKKEVKAIQGFITTVPQTAIVVTSTHHLLQEIFTIKGKGTFIKHHQIDTTTDATDLNIKRVTKLLEDAFDKKLTPNYFNQTFKNIIYQKDYEGMAIIQDIAGIPYLDKFAVSKIHEGTGLGKSLWNAITKTYPQLVWRSTPENPFNSFYMRECDGCIKYPNWIIYWRKLPDEKILKIASAIAKKPASFVAKDK